MYRKERNSHRQMDDDSLKPNTAMMKHGCKQQPGLLRRIWCRVEKGLSTPVVRRGTLQVPRKWVNGAAACNQGIRLEHVA
jgi:hypothetical protein